MDYACAKFNKPCVRHKSLCVVETKNVKSFTGDEVTKKKNVRISCGESYCAAILLFIGETEETITAFMKSSNNSKRLKIPNYKAIDSPSSDTETENEKHKCLKRKVDENDVNGQNILQIKLAKLKSFENKSDPTEAKSVTLMCKPASSRQTENEIRKSPLERTMHEMAKIGAVGEINMLNIKETIGEEGDTAVSDKDIPLNNKKSQTSESAANLKLKLMEREKTIKKLKQENAQLKIQLRDEIDLRKSIFSLNIELQRDVIGEFSNVQLNLKDLKKQVTGVANASGKECADRAGAIRGEEIHLGRGVWIRKACYDAIAGRSRMTPSLFVKEIAIAVFGIEALRVSTVTGELSNRTKSKFPGAAAPSRLDAVKVMAIRDITYFWVKNVMKKDDNCAETEKSKVSNYISHKCSELKKKEQDMKKLIENADKERNRVLEKELNPVDPKSTDDPELRGDLFVDSDSTNDAPKIGDSINDSTHQDVHDINDDEDVESIGSSVNDDL